VLERGSTLGDRRKRRPYTAGSYDEHVHASSVTHGTPLDKARRIHFSDFPAADFQSLEIEISVTAILGLPDR
jgi:hypothetical protein